MPKNIVVFSDGTGQEGGQGRNTNVYKLFNMTEDRTERQISFYDRGLGTGWRKVTGNISGMGISKNIRECYQFIFENYNAGDQVFLFGFSRGATTVRSLSGFIHLFGILPKSRPELIKRAYKIYKTKDAKERERRAGEFVKRNHTMWCRIKFLGVWDTVAALGLPFKSLDVLVDKVPFFRHSFHNLRLSECVQHARHALAIDDERLTFHPTLWDQRLSDRQREKKVMIKQVWFCGMHTDVGGGYPEQELSDIPLTWMVQEATEHGLRIYPNHDIELQPDPNGTMHDSRGSTLTKFYRRRVRSWNVNDRGKPRVHESVVMRKRNEKNAEDPPYKPWILKKEYEKEPWPETLRTPGRIVDFHP
jgi:uncharacterized protein (DUF2235 family)